VVIAADEAGPTEVFGMQTGSAEQPEPNLYYMAKQEFEDVPYKAVMNYRFILGADN
jgi:hypothetical protein